MSKISAFNLAIQVEQMRNAQKLYFQQIKIAKSTKRSEDFITANKTLAISKQLEQVVDDTIRDVNSQTGIQGIIDQDATIAIASKAMGDVRSILMDKYGLFGGGAELNQVFEILNGAIDIAEGKEPGV